MAGTSLFALIDDIASVLDDVALLTKVAAKKTAGVLGDDLALNAEQVAGVRAERELPVVWAVAKGSFLNKVILVPMALGLSVFAPWLVTPLLMLGGAYLCFEGFEKLFHAWQHRSGKSTSREQAEHVQALADPDADLVALEQAKIKGAIRTDFVLSAEIIVIALGTVQGATLSKRIAVVSAIALLMTVGVYGLVALLVKLDDIGAVLLRRGSALSQAFGRFLITVTPKLMHLLSIAGTAAMFLVGGGILLHGLGHRTVERLEQVPLLSPVAGALVGLAVGGGMLAALHLYRRLLR